MVEPLAVRDPRQDFSLGPGIRDWWFSHATNLIQIGDKFMITDPIFESYASPVPGFIVRSTPAPTNISELPKISYVLISHCHWDHLCKASVKRIAKLNPDCKFFVPLKVGTSFLKHWGIKNIVEFDWMTRIVCDDIEFTCLPCHHGTSRWGVDSNSSLWCSWMIKSPEGVLIYYSGDTAIGPHFKIVNELFGRGPDLFIVGIGPQEPKTMMRAVHLDGPQAIEMAKILDCVRMTPMHYGTFPLGVRPDISDLQLLLNAYSDEQKEKLIVLDVGGRIDWNGTTFEKGA